MKNTFIITFLLCLCGFTLKAQDKPKLSENIRLNQMGYYPNQPKVAIVVDAPAVAFYITTPDLKDTLFGGPLQLNEYWKASGENVRALDFSRFNKPGSYVIAVPEVGYSHTFDIEEGVHEPVAKASIKAFYFQRTGIKLEKKYAGAWSRPEGHPDKEVYIHASAASPERPAGTVINSSKGWYDAGDYGKYIVNSGITTFHLMSLYEHFPNAMDTMDLNIPESGNDIPDVLDEVLWNLRWMQTMQDPYDGGVYHKLSTARFQDKVMPHTLSHVRRYIIGKGTGASLNFAAVMAQAARVYEPFMPEFADSCLKAARRAYDWALKNPAEEYKQSVMNAKYAKDGGSPEMFNEEVVTGEYGDSRFDDEFFWAAAELFTTTHDFQYKDKIQLSTNFGVPTWNYVNTLGLITLYHNQDKVGDEINIGEVKDKLVEMAEPLKEALKVHPYKTIMGFRISNFVWGSNFTAANQGVLCLQAYDITEDKGFLKAALANLDYVLGRNATGYSFVTGYGDNPAMHPHHRPSKGDDVIDPVPGFMVGGPHSTYSGDCTMYKYKEPARHYRDDWCSYSTNEIAINWNGSFAYLANAVEILID